MQSDKLSKFCPTCQCETEHVNEANRAAGTIVFAVSVLSCGLLFPITLPLTIYLLLTSKPKSYCRVCRSANP